jgi:YYY domain-containing protein
MEDALAVLKWWLLLQAMGLVALPLVFRLLRWLPDRGYSVAKPAGLLLGTYLLWLLGSLGWLRNTEGGIVLAFGSVAAASAWVYARWDDGVKLRDWLRAHRGWIVAYEAVFLIALVFWSIFRAHNPDLSTTEKPMEFAFMNAIARSTTFPPPDPWLSGFSISYYHFGYVMMSTLMKASGVNPGVAFSLTNAMWFALTAAGAFGIAANLVAASKRATTSAIVATGLLGALFVPLLANFQGPLEVAHTNAIGSPEFWRWLDIREINTPPTPLVAGETRWPFCENCAHPRGNWWFWRASRVVHDYPIGSDRGNPNDYEELIDEFPFFSFLLGDNHPHVLALPYALMSIALAFNLFRLGNGSTTGTGGTQAITGRAAWRGWFWDAAPMAVAYPVFLGALSFLNTWDFPIHVFIAALAWSIGRWIHARSAQVAGRDETLAAAAADDPLPLAASLSSGEGNLNLVSGVGRGRLNAAALGQSLWWDALVALAACGVLGAIAYLPFYIGFRSQAAGLLPNLFWPTRLPQFFVMFGPFVLIGGALLATLLVRVIRQRVVSVGRAASVVIGGGAAIVVATALLAAIATWAVLRLSGSAAAKADEWVGVLEEQGISVGQAIAERLGEFGVPLAMGIALAGVVFILRTIPAVRTPGLPVSAAERRRAAGRSREALPDMPPANPIGGFRTASTPTQSAGLSQSSEDGLPFALMLFGVGALLTFAVEFVYLLDFFTTRMNTVFKFYYQAWALWGVASAFAVYYLWASTGRVRNTVGRVAFAGLVAVGVAGGLVYTILGLTGGTLGRPGAPTLDARAWTIQYAPDEVAAIAWLDQNVGEQATILEAEGQSYHDSTSRVSAWTGLPGVLGWVGHEGQWRGRYDDISPRTPDIDLIYSTTDPATALSLLRKYGVDYVYVGPNEQAKYPPAGLAKFDVIADRVFQQGASAIYRVRGSGATLSAR